MNLDWNTIANIFATTVTIVSGLGAVLAFWDKWVYKPIQEKREEKAEERNKKLIQTIEEFSKPIVDTLERTKERTDKLEKFVEETTVTIDNHEERIGELERVSNRGGNMTYEYKETTRGVNS